MKNNNKMTRKTKDEKRRLAFEKRNVKKEQNLARYGAEGGSALVMAKTGDISRRFIAALLAIVFVLTTLVIGVNFATKAEDESIPSTPADEGANNNLVLEKAISAETDGTYTLRLSAYATGQIRNTTKQIPTDYVLVVDQSGSMSYTDMPTDYEPATTPSGGWSFDDFDTNTGDDKAYYYFDEEGRILRNGTTPDGFQTNEEGILIGDVLPSGVPGVVDPAYEAALIAEQAAGNIGAE